MVCCAIRNSDESQVSVSPVKISVFSKRFKEMKHEMLKEVDWGKLFQTAGAEGTKRCISERKFDPISL